MNHKVPTYRQIAWLSIVPQLLVMALLVLAFKFTGTKDFVLYGAITYLVISYLLRNVVAGKHRKGMQQVKANNFQQAIPLFEESLAYFQNNEWIDKYRYLTLLSSSKMSYKEMALVNIAFCYGQLGEGEKAREYYNEALKENPNNGMAIAALKLLDSAQNLNTKE